MQRSALGATPRRRDGSRCSARAQGASRRSRIRERRCRTLASADGSPFVTPSARRGVEVEVDRSVSERPAQESSDGEGLSSGYEWLLNDNDVVVIIDPLQDALVEGMHDDAAMDEVAADRLDNDAADSDDEMMAGVKRMQDQIVWEDAVQFKEEALAYYDSNQCTRDNAFSRAAHETNMRNSLLVQGLMPEY